MKSDVQIAERILAKEIRRAKRMLVRRKFREPSTIKRQWKMPKFNGASCEDCGRPKYSISKLGRCRECHQKYVYNKYLDKVKAEDERVALAEKILNQLLGVEP